LGRILALDYGRKRVGVAVSDPLEITANGLETLDVKNVRDFIRSFLEKEEVDCLVIGYPKQMNNLPSEASQYVDGFLKWFNREYPDLKVEKVDERFTSRMAQKAMIDGGVKKSDRQNKYLVDKVSAVLILQSYLDSKKHSSYKTE